MFKEDVIELISKSESVIKRTENGLWLPFEKFDSILNSKNLEHGQINKKVIGYSEEKRPIYELSWGTGSRVLFVWSQMHGDEATGTWGIIDLIDLLTGILGPELFERYAGHIRIVIIPMLNPDGATKFIRRTALGIDMNRDARQCQTLGMQILQKRILHYKPFLALNLHDQRSIFGAGDTGKPAIISFLNPSFNKEKNLSESRVWAMRVIGLQVNLLKQMINDSIGRYSDAFYPTAAGEWVQEQNIPCILVESGWGSGDMDKLIPRKCHIPIFLGAMEACKNPEDLPDASIYEMVPENTNSFFDLIAEKTIVNGKITNVNSGFIRRRKVENETIIDWLELVDYGDLRWKYAHERLKVIEVLVDKSSINALINNKVNTSYRI
jgi:hypothetical protein